MRLQRQRVQETIEEAGPRCGTDSFCSVCCQSCFYPIPQKTAVSFKKDPVSCAATIYCPKPRTFLQVSTVKMILYPSPSSAVTLFYHFRIFLHLFIWQMRLPKAVYNSESRIRDLNKPHFNISC